jgi:YidC/Oxa1 family membrane protein insertase
MTIVIRGVMYPLTRRQLKATRKMQELQPKLAELKKKHGKDQQKMAQEQMRLYKESGVSPLGCMGPLLIQMPIWIALYQAIIRVLATSPESLLNLSGYLYDWPVVYSALPLNNHFLWMNLAVPDFFLAIIVGATMWVSQKMATQPSSDPQQKSQGQMLTIMMPFLFFFISMSFPSGLALYWVVSNLIQITMQYFALGGWGNLLPARMAKKQVEKERDKKIKKRITEAEAKTADVAAVEADITSEQLEEGLQDETGSEKRPDSGGGYTTGIRRTVRRSRRSKSRRRKRR